ncbi:gamma carbonic anhydrase family protein [Burkholderia sola]|uniref:gamma carbonic anhydrase family protein n=1 Tax=Burkholderia sola TaxID=2843302 RepID=UPI0023DDC774|nr:gamma carbonic anhydrase family protein [Burkholderia sola]MDF3084389.1 gamma carbonic anhydrase family protein [Burkholderia sola]
MSLFFLDGQGPSLPDDGSVWIAPNATVIGNVVIGRQVSIWFGAVVRGDNETITIRDGTNVQDGVVLHSDRGSPLSIGADCTIGHRSILHGCTVGDGCVIGMGAVILNGATIGKDSLVGAGAMVTEGKSFPDGSLIVGAPAKAIRTLDEATIASLQAAAESYRANARRFARGLQTVDA